MAPYSHTPILSHSHSPVRLRSPQAILPFTILLFPSLCSAGVVAERELLLRNPLGVHRPDEVVTVPLNDLDVAVEVERRIVDVEITDASGKRLPCQYDPFGQLPGLRSEVALAIDLKPHETRLLVIRFLDAKRDGVEEVCAVKLKERAVQVTTPIYSVRSVSLPHSRG